MHSTAQLKLECELPKLEGFRSKCRRVLRHHYTAQVSAELDHALARSMRRFEQLHRAKNAGRRRQLSIMGRLLNCSDTKIVAAIEIAAKYEHTLTLNELRSRIKASNPWRQVSEPISVLRRETGKNKVRFLCKFGPLRNASQWIVAEAVRAMMPDCPHEYAQRGMGRDRAIRVLIEALNGGERDDVVITGDVFGFFSNIPADTVARLLPLPRSVIKNCLYVNEGDVLDLGGMDLGDDVNKQIRNGLPQGARSSGIIAQYVMHEMMRDLTHDGVSVSYRDDFAIGPVPASDGEAIIKALHSRASALLTGPRQFKTLETTPLRRLASRRLTLLGYRFRRSETGSIRVTPTCRSLKRFSRKRLMPALRKAPYKDLDSTATRMAAAFRASQTAWDYETSADTFEAMVQSEVSCEKARRGTVIKLTGKKGISPMSVLMCQGQSELVSGH